MTKIKFCGLSRMQDIDYVNQCRPDYAGFVFAPSKRQITPETARELRSELRDGICAVGVFVDHDIEQVCHLCQSGIIDVVQLHGNEDEAYIQSLKGMCGVPIIRAIGVGDHLPVYEGDADYLLYDSLSVQRGGSGKAFDWLLLKEAAHRSYFLAGGLHTGNVGQAIALLHPYCVDVSSGIETDGVKDLDKMVAFAKIVRGTAHAERR